MTPMANSVKPTRAWIPATVTTMLTMLLLFGCGLLREILDDQDIAKLRDPENPISTYLYGPMAPVGGPGIVGERPFGEVISEFGAGLVPVVVLVFLFTWLSARAARSGSSFTVLLGAWLGTVLGVGLGGLASYQVFLWNVDLPEGAGFLHLERLRRLEHGLYWGATGGLLIALVALLIWLIARPRADKSSPEPSPEPVTETSSWPPPVPDEPATYPPEPKHAGTSTSEDTVPAPDPLPGDRPPSRRI